MSCTKGNNIIKNKNIFHSPFISFLSPDTLTPSTVPTGVLGHSDDFFVRRRLLRVAQLVVVLTWPRSGVVRPLFTRNRRTWLRDSASFAWLSGHPVVCPTSLQLHLTSPCPQLPRSAPVEARAAPTKLVTQLAVPTSVRHCQATAQPPST